MAQKFKKKKIHTFNNYQTSWMCLFKNRFEINNKHVSFLQVSYLSEIKKNENEFNFVKSKYEFLTYKE